MDINHGREHVGPLRVTPLRVAPRMKAKVRNLGIKPMRKPKQDKNK